MILPIATSPKCHCPSSCQIYIYICYSIAAEGASMQHLGYILGLFVQFWRYLNYLCLSRLFLAKV